MDTLSSELRQLYAMPKDEHIGKLFHLAEQLPTSPVELRLGLVLSMILLQAPTRADQIKGCYGIFTLVGKADQHGADEEIVELMMIAANMIFTRFSITIDELDELEDSIRVTYQPDVLEPAIKTARHFRDIVKKLNAKVGHLLT
jgi:hypothetical protein